MSILRKSTVILFGLSLSVYLSLLIYHCVIRKETPPVIVCQQELLEVSVRDGEAELLKGVEAWDRQDGELTGEVVVEQTGPFLTDGSRKVTYAVCDRSNQVSRLIRTLRYRDYSPPKITFEGSLCFREGEEVDLLSCLHAEDVLDGDITDRIQKTYGDLKRYPDAGRYPIGFQVSNSAGDIAEIDLTVEILR